MNPVTWLLKQAGRPSGWAGRLLVRGMNRGHGPMTEWALSHVPLQDVGRVLDVGCGGGMALALVGERAPEAELHGVDPSPASLDVAAKTHRRLVEAGRLLLREAKASTLPYDDDFFDLTLAINSHYFWPDLEADLGEVLRALRPGGTVVLSGGEYFGGKHDARIRKLAARGPMNCQTLEELRDALVSAGYAEAKVHEEWDKGWFCVVGKKGESRR